jgi:endonuclease I
MKKTYLIISLSCFQFGISQIPPGYYDNATGTSYILKTQLYNIINQQNDQEYNAIDGFFADYDLDNYYENDNSILDIYSEDPNGNDPYNFTPVDDECGNYIQEGDCYNKEHIIPKFVFSENPPMQGDAHHLLPTDGRVNGFRGSYPMGRVDDNNLLSQSGISNPTQNGSKLGNNLNEGYSSGYNGIVFEPIDEFKGDIARIHFYFATRYENLILSWLEDVNYNMFNGSNNQVFDSTFLNILIEWHNMDPVSQKEIDRNNAIYYEYQGNRNPFIDHPEYVNAIWNSQNDNEAPSAPTNLEASNPSSTSIDLYWDPSIDNIGVSSYDIYMNGVYNNNVNSTTTTIIGLSPETNYCFYVIAKDSSNNISQPSDISCETTLDGNTGNIDLFFSEYIEGSGNNKALEIANFTGNLINLNNYSLKLSSNGNSNWTISYSFPSNSNIENGEVYVIANGGATICSEVFDNINNSITGFNGNDAIGLFKNDILIDIIGTLGNSDTFAQNTTLVRNSNIAAGSSIFDTDQWDSYEINSCENLGIHNQVLDVENNMLNSIKLVSNPFNGNILEIISEKYYKYEILNISGIKLYNGNINPGLNQINNLLLSSGTYILKLISKNSIVVKKILKK